MNRSLASWGLAAVMVVGVAVVVAGATGRGSSASSLDDASRFAAPMPLAGVATVAPVPTVQVMGPTSVAVPTLGIIAGITAATLLDGQLTPPLDPGVVGAWSDSAPLDAAAGEVTLAGHVNYGSLGAFAFGRLAELAPGDLVYTTDAQGRQTAWRIDSVTGRGKAAGVDPAAFRGSAGPRELVLITCGGVYDAGSHSYEANVYVYAHPAALA